MKPVFLRFTDSNGEVTKTFTTCSLKTGTLDNILDIAERAEELKGANITEIRAFYKDLKAIIADVFKGQFTFDELNENVEQEELEKVFKDLCSRISGEMQKN